MQTGIVNILLEATAERLLQKLLTDVTDESKAGLVRTGKLQDDPTSRKVNILIHPGGEDWPDKLSVDGSGVGKHVENAYTIGGAYGGIFWRRRALIEIQMFYTNESDRDTSRMRSHVVLSRAHHALNTWDVGRETPKDDFGEKAYDLQVVQSWLREGGGEGAFNWRGEIRIEFLTEIEPTEF